MHGIPGEIFIKILGTKKCIFASRQTERQYEYINYFIQLIIHYFPSVAEPTETAVGSKTEGKLLKQSY